MSLDGKVLTMLPNSRPGDPPLRVFAPCSFTWDNKGDAALAIALNQSLRREFGDQTEVVFASLTPEYDAERYRMPFLPMPMAPSGFLRKVSVGTGRVTRQRWLTPIIVVIQMIVLLTAARLWYPIYARTGERALRLVPRPLRKVTREVLRADISIAVPGGYLKAAAIEEDGWLYHAAALLFCKVMRKPVILYPVSIGPFVGWHNRAARYLLQRVDSIMVREEISRETSIVLGANPARIHSVPDSVFMLEEDTRAETELPLVLEHFKQLDRPWIGVSVRHFGFPGDADPKAAYESYLSAVANTVDELIDRFGISAIFVPQRIGAGDTKSRFERFRASDVVPSREVRERMKHPEQAIVLEDDVSPQTLMALYGNFEIMIGTRMHANILTMVAGTPVVAIAYEPKTTGIMATLGLSRYCVQIRDTAEKLLPATLALWSEREKVSSQLAREIPAIRKGAQAAAGIVRDVLESHPSGTRFSVPSEIEDRPRLTVATVSQSETRS